MAKAQRPGPRGSTIATAARGQARCCVLAVSSANINQPLLRWNLTSPAERLKCPLSQVANLLPTRMLSERDLRRQICSVWPTYLIEQFVKLLQRCLVLR